MKTKYHSYKGLAAACAVAFALTGCSMLEMEKAPTLEPGSRAAELYPRAVAGDAKAQFEFAVCYSNGNSGAGPKNDSEALKWYLKSAKQGYSQAQALLATFYEAGIGGVERNKKEEIRWRLAAAQNGSYEAQFYIADYYEKGYGDFPTNMYEAFRWYHKAAQQGHGGAMFRLAKCYQYGKGCTSSREDAIYWYRKALNTFKYKDARKALKELGAL